MAERRSPLYDIHLRTAARMVKGGGDYLFPWAYTAPAEEHLNVRRNVGMQDLTSMGEVDIKGPVCIGSSVSIEPGVSIVGPAWIGHGCTLRAKSTVRRSILFEYTRIAANMCFEDMIVSPEYCVDRHGTTLYQGDENAQLRWGDARG